MRGDASRFTRQDGVEEQWRIMQPLLDAPPPVHPYAKGTWGPAAGDQVPARARRLARTVGGVMTTVDGARAEPQSAAAPSPFPPIADYGFLSNCHTAALVAPDGAIGWLCVPSFDSSSVFGTLLDRQAGEFRVGPFGINVPTARAYEPGTNTLVTTWHAHGGWVEVRDALTMGPRRGEDTVTPHTRPPADIDGDHLLIRTITCIAGSVEMELVCEPVFDYGRDEARVDAGRRRPPHRRRARPASDAAAADRPRDGHRGQPRTRPPDPARRASGRSARCPGRPSSSRRRTSTEADARLAATTRRSGARGSRRPGSRTTAFARRSSVRRWPIKGLTYMPTGATVAAPTTSLPETPGGERNWDYRYAWMRDSTFTLQALHWLNLDWEAEEFMQFVADLEPNADGAMQIMYGIDGRRDLTESTRDDLSGYAGARPVRIGNGAFDQRQNDVYGAVLDCILLHTRRSQRLSRRLWPIVETQAECAIARLARARPGHLGGARRAAALRLLEAHVLGRDGPRGQARRDPRRRRAAERAGGAVADEIRADILEHGVERARRAAPALRDRRARRLEPAGRDLRLPARRRPAAAGERAARSPTS